MKCLDIKRPEKRNNKKEMTKSEAILRLYLSSVLLK